MRYKVLIPQYIPADSLRKFSDLDCDIVTDCGSSEAELIAAIGDADAVVARTAPYTAAVLAAAKKLKIIARYGIGVDNIDVDAAARAGIWVSNTPFSILSSVAEHTICLMLALAKNLHVGDRELRRGNFGIRNQLTGVDLAGKTVGLIGLGRIGSMVAQKCRLGLDMRVLAYDPYLPPDRAPQGVELCKNWDKIFQTADVISMHLPLTDATRGIVGAREFEMMKESAFFINCARGGIVREKELIRALQTGKIAGAGLDVYENEDPGQDSPLYALDNTILTPHCASFTRDAYLRMGADAAACVESVLFKQEPPPWPVNHPPMPRRD